MNFKCETNKNSIEKAGLVFVFCSLFFLHLCLPSLKKLEKFHQTAS